MPETQSDSIILEMIVRQCELHRILDALCRQLGASRQERQVAFFLPSDGRWKLAAAGDLLPESLTVLSEIAPEGLSLALVSRDPTLPDGEYGFFGPFVARNLYTGLGELVGLLVFLNPVSAGTAASSFEGKNDSRIARLESTCRLAVLAIEQHNLLEELTWQADHDAVTGLRTRTCFERLLRRRLQAGDATAALLCINLDRFRLVNDVLGHSFGNRVLKCVGGRFQSCLGPDATLARVGGDEFAVLTTEAEAAATADLLLAAFATQFSIEGHQLYLGASIGIACARSDSTLESMQREGYIALYHAKHSGKGRWVKFDSSMAAIPPERLEMELCLRSALAKNEMELYYQAQVQLSTGIVLGAEVLLRWRCAGLGSISPTIFVPILEETGLIVDVGRWVLLEACRQGMDWRRANGVSPRLSVNVSSVQFVREGFAGDVERILAETGFPAAFLELELTESVFVGDFDRACDVFRQIQALGVRIAIDDFGAGQASLSYLLRLPFNRLKIDRSFISEIGEVNKCPPLVRNIVRMASSLGMTTVAEGIDQPCHVDILRSMGCEEGQGYLFSEPVPASEFLPLWLNRSTGFANLLARETAVEPLDVLPQQPVARPVTI